MKWFKHDTDCFQSEGVAKLKDEFGEIEGYGRWVLLLEIVASKMDETDWCSAEYSALEWGRLLKQKQKKLETFLELCENFLGIFVERNENFIRISIPNLLKKRDNASKKSRQRADNVPSRSRLKSKDKDVDKEKDKEKSNKKEKPGVCVETLKSNFKQDWKSYPKTNGANKTKAFECYKRTVGVDPLKRSQFCVKTTEYLATFNGDLEYCKNAETWFRNWEGIEVSKDEKTVKLSWSEKMDRGLPLEG